MIRPALLLLAVLPAIAADEILLHTGFSLRALRHEVVGEMMRIHTAEGTVEIPKSSVASIEALPEVAPKPAVAPAPPVAAPAAVAEAPKPKSPQEILRDAAHAHGLPPEFLLSIARVESAFQPKAVSPKGAIGVMQLMPGTARQLNVDPHDPEQNIEGGARLLRDLLIQYRDYPDQVYRALSAYNAGPGAVQKYNGVPPYAETRHYVEKVLNEYHRLKTSTKPGSTASNR